MAHLIGTLCFVGFVVTGLAVVCSERATARTRRACLTVFLLYCLGASFGAGLTQRNFWPFAHWPLVSGMLPAAMSFPRLMAVDSAGGEHAIDHRAWQPLSNAELHAWIKADFARLDQEAQDQVGQHLLRLAEHARARMLSGAGVGYLDRWLGPLTAPFFHLYAAVWSRYPPPSVPFIGIRMYDDEWRWHAHLQSLEIASQRLVYEYRQP